jgi:2,3-bisphosphoglycerate-independent phosphoglycerate mutase
MSPTSLTAGLEDPFPGEDRELVSSPMVATYDKAPEMSAEAVTDDGDRSYG